MIKSGNFLLLRLQIFVTFLYLNVYGSDFIYETTFLKSPYKLK
jgi:hypothetical protein